MEDNAPSPIEVRELGRVIEDKWEQKENALLLINVNWELLGKVIEVKWENFDKVLLSIEVIEDGIVIECKVKQLLKTNSWR